MNDTFCINVIFCNNAEPEQILEHINQMDQIIEYTLVKEKDGILNFLDATVIKNQTTLISPFTKSRSV